MRLDKTYVFDEAIGVWRRPRIDTEFTYSDGDEVEEDILARVTNAADRSSGSHELDPVVQEWPAEYHLSPSRSNLLMPFEFKGLRVLEIGAGCGAITRFLGEVGGEVIGVEGSLRRGQIAASRCEGLENVKICCDNFRDFQSDGGFDVITAIGVLEYAPAYFGGQEPVRSFLKTARRLLSPSGCLIVGIENRLGLKYFTGCTEDHTGELFYGLEDRNDAVHKPITFGRSQLDWYLKQVGFSTTRFFYPFTDYKLPSLILSEEGVRDPELGAGRILGESLARDYLRPRDSLFSEQAAWSVIDRNQLTEDLSNSFLVFASQAPDTPALSSVDWLAKIFTGYRRKECRTITTLRRTDESIKVFKARMYPDLDELESPIVRMTVQPVADFIPGVTLGHVLMTALLDPTTTYSDFLTLLKPWRDLLEKNLLPDSGDGSPRLLPGEFFDCIPRNLLLNPGDPPNPYFFDCEYRYLGPLTVAYIVFRGLFHFRVQLVRTDYFKQTPLRDIILRVIKDFGSSATEEDLDDMVEQEAEFLSTITLWRKANRVKDAHEVLSQPFHVARDLGELMDLREQVAQRDAHIGRLNDEIFHLNRHLNEVLNSLSWKITAPLRYVFDRTVKPVSSEGVEGQDDWGEPKGPS